MGCLITRFVFSIIHGRGTQTEELKRGRPGNEATYLLYLSFMVLILVFVNTSCMYSAVYFIDVQVCITKNYTHRKHNGIRLQPIQNNGLAHTYQQLSSLSDAVHCMVYHHQVSSPQCRSSYQLGNVWHRRRSDWEWLTQRYLFHQRQDHNCYASMKWWVWGFH